MPPRCLAVAFLLATVSQASEPSFPAVDAEPLNNIAPDVAKDGRLHFLTLDLLDPDGHELDHVVTWLQTECRFHELMQLPPATIDAKVIEQTDRDGETLCRVAVQNTSNVPTVQVWLKVLHGQQGDEVLPCFWSDNALTLLPGQQREVTVRFRTKLLDAATPHPMAEGWNVTPAEWDIGSGKPVVLAMEVADCKLLQEADNTKVQFTATGRGPAGSRWTTWPMPVKIDGKLARYVRIGLRCGESSTATLTLASLPAGSHRIGFGDVERVVTVP